MSSLTDFMQAQSIHKKSDSKISHKNNNNNLTWTIIWLPQLGHFNYTSEWLKV